MGRHCPELSLWALCVREVFERKYERGEREKKSPHPNF